MDKFKCVGIGALAGIINGLFGSGGGMIVVPGLTKIMRVEQYKAHATAIAVILPITISSSLVYAYGKFLNYNLALYTALGGIVGGLIGAYLLKKIPGNLLRVVFGGFMLFAAVRMFI